MSAQVPGAPEVIRQEAGESVELRLAPHWLAIFLRRPGVWSLAIAIDSALLFNPWFRAGWATPIAVLVGVFVWETIEWLSRRYTLTDKRVIAEAGVLRRAVVDVRLANVQHAAMTQSISERLLGLGSIAFASSGTGGYDVVWRFLEKPVSVLERARAALDEADDRAGRNP